MDSILLKGIRVSTHIGVPEAERKNPQDLLIDIELFHPTKEVAKTESLESGLNYEDITNEVVRMAKTERKTIERFAEEIATAIIAGWKPQGGVKVTVWKKPALPLESASVTITRP